MAELASIQFSVTDPGNIASFPSVIVTLGGEGGFRQAVSDDEGMVRFNDLPLGAYQVNAVLSDRAYTSRKIILHEPSPHRIALFLDPRRSQVQ